MKKRSITLRIDEAQARRLEKATTKAKNPYAPTITAVVQRGIDLALAELQTKVVEV